MKRPFTVDVRPVRVETLSPQEFIDLVDKSPWLIARSQVEAPRLGSSGFGKIRVEYSRPIYKAPLKLSPVAR